MVNVAICQVGSVIYNTSATLKKLEKFTEIAARKQAQLIVFPGTTKFFCVIFKNICAINFFTCMFFLTIFK